ncbi:hypothetical protein N665_0009s0073 [Sinapis alba]|nr:hypothetical protein N665_0009s0073 [Sinapis alba]
MNVRQESEDKVMIELRDSDGLLTNPTTRKKYKLKAICHAGPVIDPGGIFDYARKI